MNKNIMYMCVVRSREREDVLEGRSKDVVMTEKNVGKKSSQTRAEKITWLPVCYIVKKKNGY